MEQSIIDERFELVRERILAIQKQNDAIKPFDAYFGKVSAFLLRVLEVAEELKLFEPEGNYWWKNNLEATLKTINHSLFEDVLKDNYEISFANPRYATEQLGEEFGPLLAAIYTDVRSALCDIFESKKLFITARLELFVEIYNMFEEELPKYEEVRSAFYWYMSDYSDTMFAHGIIAGIVPEECYITKIINECEDWDDLRYLYRFRYHVSEDVIKTAKFINSLPKEDVDAIADTYVGGYRRGFEIANKDISKKKTVQIRFCPGFERIVKRASEMFAEIGLSSTYIIMSKVNEQYHYDHRYDNGLYLDKAFVERRLSVVKRTYEDYKQNASEYAGPAVIETFGEEPFTPEDKKECVKLNDKQRKIHLNYISKNRAIIEAYMPHDEVSFTIIAFPVPKIGENFEEIFKETVRINTLDNDVYGKVQQTIIDELDKCSYVRILGKGNNRTDLTVNLVELSDPATQTKFENCRADVNIPLGEVFTSPKLKGTDGILHVSEVYLNDLKYIDFQVEFKDGCVVDYTCKNFPEELANKMYVKENVLMNHDTLPMGEFAVGTNTTAYRMAQKYDIVYKMPILIVEKMGPHFAVGDTCYSRSEDFKVYNPDGKEIIARENDFSVLRDSEPEKAYFNCHTDITIPYHEIGEISFYDENGNKTVLIENGRFVLPGTELLNKAFDE
ncbi:MAG: leucyl aminopeptidase [Lachnospiraceae bacterium]|nr:leucyl aminopeptidase [Lachnospiraceae bacterium]